MDGLVVAGIAGLAGKIAYDIAGPFAKELGEMLKDELRPFRAANEVNKKLREWCKRPKSGSGQFHQNYSCPFWKTVHSRTTQNSSLSGPHFSPMQATHHEKSKSH
jgi:hypothetical protein